MNSFDTTLFPYLDSSLFVDRFLDDSHNAQLLNDNLDMLLPADLASSVPEAPQVYEEIIDFFVDDNQPGSLLMASSGPMPVSPTLSSAPSNRSSTSVVYSHPLKTALSKLPGVSKHEHAVDKLALKRERNRLAAERCRTRRLETISALQTECDSLRAEIDRLRAENSSLREYVLRKPALQF